jgi:RNA polymerase sigma-70 factor (ECF subfamily)
MPKAMDEALLREHHAAGRHADVVTILISELGPHLLGFVRSRIRDDAVAEDAYAAFCLDLWRSMPSFRMQCSFEGWAYLLLRNTINRTLARVVRPRRQELGISQLSAFPELEAAARTTLSSANAPAAMDQFAALREQLDEDEQTLLVLRVDRDLAWKDVAQVFLGGEAEDAALEKEAAKLRQRFQALKVKLARMATDAGLLP